MATVVYLDGTEAIGSLRARVQHAEDHQVVLVVPHRVEGLRDPVCLKLLVRGAQQWAVDLALVTHDRQTRENARQEGIPVYGSLGQVRRGWLRAKTDLRPTGILRPLREPRVTPAGIVTAFFGFFLVAAVAWAVVFYLLPSATVSLVPAAEALSQTVELTATTQRRAPAPNEGQIPARPIEVKLEMADQMPTTGRRPAPAERASGQVTLANRTAGEVKVPRGSRFAAAGGVQFYTLDEVTLRGPQWSTARVGIIAAEPGRAGNVPAQAISQVAEPGLVLNITVVNENPTSGGSDKIANYVTFEDRNRLKARALDKVKQEAFARIMAARAESESVYPESVTVTLLDEVYDQAAGDEANMLGLRVLVALKGLAFEGRAANEVATKVLAQRIPTNTQLVPGSFRTAPLEAYEWGPDFVSFRLLIEGKVAPAIDAAAAREAILGMRVDEAEAYLARTLRLAARPRVKLQPSWATTLPLLAPRVTMQVGGEAGP